MLSRSDIVSKVPLLVKRLAETKPLCHNMTNLVVQNFAANVALAVYVVTSLDVLSHF